jgi:hypothetical protein
MTGGCSGMGEVPHIFLRWVYLQALLHIDVLTLGAEGEPLKQNIDLLKYRHEKK